MNNRHRAAALVLSVITLVLWFGSGSAQASSPVGQQTDGPTVTAPPAPSVGAPDGSADEGTTDGGSADGADGGSTTVDVNDDDTSLDIDVDLGSSEQPGEVPSQTVTIILGLTVLALVPSILIMMTSFTRFVVVLSLVRNALGLQSIPPNQVIAGLALFLSLFVMAPTLSAINDVALQPYLDGEITQSQALERAEEPMKAFLLANTRRDDLDLMIELSGQEAPEKPEDTSLVTLVPAFVISELQAAFIIGIVVFIPFLVLDLVVSAGLMSLGMMMLPPVFVSLPLKLLLFVMVDGWGLVTTSLVSNYQGVAP